MSILKAAIAEEQKFRIELALGRVEDSLKRLHECHNTGKIQEWTDKIS